MSIIINVSDLFSFEKEKIALEDEYQLEPISYAGEEIVFLSPLKAKASLIRIKSGILLEGKISAEVELTCSRCLKRFPLKVESRIRETFASRENLYLFEDEETVKEISPERTVDIEPSIREMMILSLPAKPLCEQECKGLCPVCGENLNEHQCGCETEFIDERLKILKKLKDSM